MSKLWIYPSESPELLVHLGVRNTFQCLALLGPALQPYQQNFFKEDLDAHGQWNS